jgi:hypothetical protein
LLDANFIKKVYHLDWLTNPVLVPKMNKDWRFMLIILILIRHVKKIPSGSPESIRLWTPQLVAAF